MRNMVEVCGGGDHARPSLSCVSKIEQEFTINFIQALITLCNSVKLQGLTFKVN